MENLSSIDSITFRLRSFRWVLALSSATCLALWLPLWRCLWGQPELGHQPHLIEIEVDFRELAALESRNEGARHSDGLVRRGDRRAPRHLQRSRVGSLHVAQLRNPVPGPELAFHHQPDVRERLEERLEPSPDRLRPLDPLGMLWIPLDDRVQMQAFKPVQVVVVQGLHRCLGHLEILFYAHRLTSSFHKGFGYSKRAPPRLPSRFRIRVRPYNNSFGLSQIRAAIIPQTSARGRSSSSSGIQARALTATVRRPCRS